MGRKKLEMKLVENSNSRQVIFSKRRNGLFKKASELVTLCGVEVAILAFSPGNKPFSFGHPGVDVLLDRFLKKDSDSSVRHETKCSKKIKKLNKELADLLKELETETEKGKLLDQKMENKRLKKAKASAESLGEVEHEELQGLLEKLNEHLEMRKNEMEACHTLLLLSKEYVKKA